MTGAQWVLVILISPILLGLAGCVLVAFWYCLMLLWLILQFAGALLGVV